MDPFVYTIEGGRVGGRPGPMKVPWNLRALAADGWTVIVSFECELLEPEHVKEIRALGLDHRTICVVDFTAPTIDQLFEFNEFVDARLAAGKKVLAHCYAGRGRTGTFLASRLVWRGMSVEDAVAEVRATPGVVAVAPTAAGSAFASRAEVSRSVALRGVEEESFEQLRKVLADVGVQVQIS